MAANNATTVEENADAVIEKKTYYELEYFANKIINSKRHERIKFWNHYVVLHALYTGKVDEHGREYEYGRVHNIQKLLKLLVTLTAATVPDDTTINGNIGIKNTGEWDEDDYKEIFRLIRDFTESIRRRDFDFNVLEDSEDERPIKKVKVDRLDPKFADRVEDLFLNLTVLRISSPVRKEVHNAWHEDGKNSNLVMEIDEEIIEKFCEEANKEETEVKETLMGILQKPDENGSRKLIENEKLEREFRTKRCFNPLSFIKLVERRSVNWLGRFFKPLVYEDDVPPANLEDVEMDMDSNASQSRNSRDRETFDESEDEEHRENRYAVANAATRSKRALSRTPSSSRHSNSPKKKAARGRTNQNKKFAHRTDYSDDEEEEEEEIDDGSGSDSEGGRRRDTRGQKQRNSTGSGKKNKRKSPQKESQKKKYPGKRMWSDEEKRAIKEGMKKHGIDRWALIKEENSVVLGDRTSGQVRDCYRTMLKRLELDDIIDEATEITENRKNNGE